ncbi:MAG: hypothetical protein GVY04_02545 [Cyanobacteria bacterium]|nr:hypothetical protein [Cyanobacteria bacterium GSL.Bin1]
MILKKLSLLIPASIFLTLSSVSLVQKTAWAQCNAFGCSQSSVAECNAFGCPKPPRGEECNAFGCPPSPQPEQNNNGNTNFNFYQESQGVSNFQFCVQNHRQEGYPTSSAVRRCEGLR